MGKTSRENLCNVQDLAREHDGEGASKGSDQPPNFPDPPSPPAQPHQLHLAHIARVLPLLTLYLPHPTLHPPSFPSVRIPSPTQLGTNPTPLIPTYTNQPSSSLSILYPFPGRPNLYPPTTKLFTCTYFLAYWNLQQSSSRIPTSSIHPILSPDLPYPSPAI